MVLAAEDDPFGRNSRVFCAIDISVRGKKYLCSFVLLYTTLLRNFLFRPLFLAIYANYSPLHPSFLCKVAKYTSCTVFSPKFIHSGEAVHRVQKVMTIFVRFESVSLQFASFFLIGLLLSYLYTTSAAQRRRSYAMFLHRRRTK